MMGKADFSVGFKRDAVAQILAGGCLVTEISKPHDLLP